MNEIDLAKKLLEINSVSGNEKEVADFLVSILKSRFKIKTQRVDNAYNIYAYVGKPKLILNTHIDTVKPFFPMTETKDYLFGRGACDTKGLQASLICAAFDALDAGFTDFGLVLDVREETDFAGIAKAKNFVKSEYVVVGEPTSFKMVVGQKGIMELELSVKGKACHSSTPEKGVSAINLLLDDLNILRNINLPENDLFGKTTCNIGVLSGGVAVNIIPDFAKAVISFRTTVDNNKVLDLLKASLKNSKIDLKLDYSPCVFDSDLKLPYKKILAPYFSEMYFWAKQSKTFVFGPGDAKYAHSKNERIKKVDIVRGRKEYFKIIKTILCR
jgi:acetylornithine deacetylase